MASFSDAEPEKSRSKKVPSKHMQPDKTKPEQFDSEVFRAAQGEHRGIPSIAAGCSPAFELLHAEFSEQLERVAWAILRDWQLATDAVQESFVLLDKKWGEVPAESRKGWLIRTVQLQSQNLRRKKRLADELPQKLSMAGGEFGTPQRFVEPQRSIEAEETIEAVRAAIEKLPAAQQEVVQMRMRENLTFSEISERLDVPLGTVLSRMRLALEKLRQNLEP